MIVCPGCLALTGACRHRTRCPARQKSASSPDNGADRSGRRRRGMACRYVVECNHTFARSLITLREDLSLNFERKCHVVCPLGFDNIGLVPENVHDGVQDLGVGFDALNLYLDGELAESIVADSSSWSISGHDNANYAIASTDTGLYQPCNEADTSATRQPTPDPLSIASPPEPQPASLPAKEYNCHTPGSPLKKDVTHELLSYCKQHGCLEDAIFLEDPIPTPDSGFSSNRGGPIRTDRKGRKVEKPYRRNFLRWRALRRNPVSEGSRDKWFKAKAKMPFSSSTSFLGSGTPAKTKATGSFYDWRTFSIAFYEPDDRTVIQNTPGRCLATTTPRAPTSTSTRLVRTFWRTRSSKM
ncbi:hypothetical protein C2E23DRAFT_852765 [Lenzites betulinus]|nr:hypothetical protein C2E23DRAFT_852765 [Lenzites betulinus]